MWTASPKADNVLDRVDEASATVYVDLSRAMPREKITQSGGINEAPSWISAAAPTEYAVRTVRGQWCCSPRGQNDQCV
jgi:hypothetical protein